MTSLGAAIPTPNLISGTSLSANVDNNEKPLSDYSIDWTFAHASQRLPQQESEQTDGFTEQRIGSDHVSTKWTDSGAYAADREASEVMPFVERPVTVMYPYERLEDPEPWLFVPGEYNGRMELSGRSAQHARYVRACPNDCLHMTTETRVNVLDTTTEGDEWHGYGGEIEVGALQPYQRRTQQKQRRLI